MNNGNWFAVSRLIFDHHLVGINGRPFTELEAWLWLIAEAEFEATTVVNKGQRMVLDPGQLMAAHGHLADRWQWSLDKVRWFLKRLQNEAMIARYCAKHDANRNTNQIQIITICNYSDYQFTGDDQHQPEPHTRQHTNHRTANAPSGTPSETSVTSGTYAPATPSVTPGQHQATHQASHQEYKDNTLTPRHKNTPLPPTGGESEPKTARKRGALTAAQARFADEAVALWNATAARLGLSVVRSVTDARRSRLLRRLDDIGGLDKFRVALSAIERVPFLMGKVAPKPGQAPFKLDIDRLLQTDGNLGDVLAKLIDKAGDEIELVGPNGKRWGWWRGKEAELRTLPLGYWRELDLKCKPNGEWPWWIMGAPPGHDECLMPSALVAECGYAEIYRGKIHHD